MNIKNNSIGIIGLGNMGYGIAINLIKAGYSITGYDLKPESISKFIHAGGNQAESSQAIVESCDIVLTCVEGHDSIEIADEILIPNARPGQIFIDHSTLPAPENRRIGKAFTEKWSKYLDAPISGGKGGAESGTLRIFVGGDKDTAEYCWALFEATGNPEKIIYCGSTGMGQVAKVVQQLTVRFPDVARLEVMAFGLNAGLDLETLMRALDISLDSRDPYARLCRGVKDGVIEKFSFIYSEWEYYLEEAKAKGFRMPMLKAMFDFCKDGEKITADAVRRPEPSVWNELIKPSKKLPKVLLLGDSIRMSYQSLVAEKLKDCAEVVGPADNCQFSLYTLSSLSRWIKALGIPHIIHWNNGIHDSGHNPARSPVQIPLDVYRMTLEYILGNLRSITPHVIWATTTPVHPDRPFQNDQWAWRNDEIDQYNSTALKLMKNNHVPVNDLHSIVASDPDLYLAEDQLHLSQAGQEKCADAVARVIREYIDNGLRDL
ncbi:hypothetical protein GF312_14090 [Candidatus Poribacteria bacterium]|nr:hypothetical protein [Candidatus Poribacteria bacterium]